MRNEGTAGCIPEQRRQRKMNNKDLLEQIRAYIEAHTEEMAEDTMSLCRINSVKGAAEPGMPYGRGPYEAMMAARELCEKYGFRTAVYENRVISADMNEGESCLDILAHMDVVAPGDGWTKTEPFVPVLLPAEGAVSGEDGSPAGVMEGMAIFGRGSSDDKGPAMAALYAMRAVKELGIPVTGRCRLILGSDEECGSSDIPYYYAAEPEAPMTFSPDAEFPLINIEKGQFRGEVTAELGSPETGNKRLISFSAGDTNNIVPGKGEMKLAGFSEEELRSAINALFDSISADYDLQAEYDEESGEMTVSAEGKTAHGSMPENGVNAGVILLQLAAALPFAEPETAGAIRKLAEIFPFGDHRGKAIGAASEDAISGHTSLSPNIFRSDGKQFSVLFDSRTCVAADDGAMIRRVKENIENAGMRFAYKFNPAHAVPAESGFVRGLLEVYEEVTGKPGKAVAIGGGTYVHRLKNGVAFGAVGETTDTHMHGPDEFMLISELKEAAVIFAMAIIRFCGAEEK